MSVAIKAIRSQVCIRVRFGSGRNIVALAVGDYQQAALFRRKHRILESLYARYAVLLEECQLRFYGRNQIGHGIEH